jgi:hypothetical protein
MSKVFTPAELQRLTISELRTLLRTVHEELARSAPGSDARRIAALSIEAINRAIKFRLAQQWNPRP